MSKVIKGAGKIFKKVAKVVKKIAPYAILAAAVIFTSGYALSAVPGLSGTFGTGLFGWSGALQTAIGSALGPGSVVGSIVSGAVTQAIVGTAVGGVTALATGGDLKKGLLLGGLGGLVSGGITGALQGPVPVPGAAAPGAATGAPRNLLANAPPVGTGAAPIPPVTVSPGTPQIQGPLPAGGLTRGADFASRTAGGATTGVSGTSGVAGTSGVSPGLLTPRTAPPVPPVTASPIGAPTPAGKTPLQRLGTFFSNPTVTAAVAGGIEGAAAGILSGDDRAEAARITANQRDREREAIQANFGGRGGLLRGSEPINSASAPFVRGRWEWNGQQLVFNQNPAG